MKKLKKNWPQTDVLDIAVDCVPKQDLIDYLMDQVTQRKNSCHVVTINAEMAYAASQDLELQKVLQQADLIIPDGIGVVWALRHSGVKVERLPGVELVEDLLRLAPSKGLRVAIWGSHPDTLHALQAVLNTDYGNPELVFCQHGYYAEEEEQDLIAQLIASKADILLVALGIPRQEQWIYQYRDRLKIPILMGIGGSLDVISGNLDRAPIWMRQTHLEWLYRLYQQPSRWRRMLALPKFVGKVLYK